jgi:hypothetical protein
LALTWTQVGWPEGVATDLEVTFEPTADGTRVTLLRTGFERVGAGAERFLEGYELGRVRLREITEEAQGFAALRDE